MATLSVDGIAIAEINGGIAGQLKHLASQGLGTSTPAPAHEAGGAGASTSPAGPKVTCCITLEFARDNAAH